MPYTNSTTDPKARAVTTAGLRALAEFLDAHPELPVPPSSMCAGLTICPTGSEEDKRAEVGRIAEILQIGTDEFGIYQAERRFGGAVAYRVVAVPESASTSSDEHGTAA